MYIYLLSVNFVSEAKLFAKVSGVQLKHLFNLKERNEHSTRMNQ